MAFADRIIINKTDLVASEAELPLRSLKSSPYDGPLRSLIVVRITCSPFPKVIVSYSRPYNSLPKLFREPLTRSQGASGSFGGKAPGALNPKPQNP